MSGRWRGSATAMFRNPHYHQPTDRADTLDYAFMAAVARATIATVATPAESQNEPSLRLDPQGI